MLFAPADLYEGEQTYQGSNTKPTPHTPPFSGEIHELWPNWFRSFLQKMKIQHTYSKKMCGCLLDSLKGLAKDRLQIFLDSNPTDITMKQVNHVMETFYLGALKKQTLRGRFTWLAQTPRPMIEKLTEMLEIAKARQLSDSQVTSEFTEFAMMLMGRS